MFGGDGQLEKQYQFKGMVKEYINWAQHLDSKWSGRAMFVDTNDCPHLLGTVYKGQRSALEIKPDFWKANDTGSCWLFNVTYNVYNETRDNVERTLSNLIIAARKHNVSEVLGQGPFFHGNLFLGANLQTEPRFQHFSDAYELTRTDVNYPAYYVATCNTTCPAWRGNPSALMQNDSSLADHLSDVVSNLTFSGVKGTIFNDLPQNASESASISEDFRTAFMHLMTDLGNVSDTTVQDRLVERIHNLSGSSYFSESDYDMKNQSWKTRYWGNKYSFLLDVKKRYDPEQFFWCRHCVGDEETP